MDGLHDPIDIKNHFNSKPDYWPDMKAEKYIHPDWTQFCAEIGISTNEIFTEELKEKFKAWKESRP